MGPERRGGWGSRVGPVPSSAEHPRLSLENAPSWPPVSRTGRLGRAACPAEAGASDCRAPSDQPLPPGASRPVYKCRPWVSLSKSNIRNTQTCFLNILNVEQRGTQGHASLLGNCLSAKSAWPANTRHWGRPLRGFTAGELTGLVWPQPVGALYQEPQHGDGRTGCPEALRGLGQTPCTTSTVSPRPEPRSEVGVLPAQVP